MQGGYNPNETLSDTDVKQIIDNLGVSNIISKMDTLDGLSDMFTDYNDLKYLRRIIQINHLQEINEDKMRAFYNITSDNLNYPHAIPICADSHWFVLCLLPDKVKHGFINVVVMDSGSGSQNIHVLHKALESIANSAGYTLSQIHNLSVQGQQYQKCCGLATALNLVSIIKTYKDYNRIFTRSDFTNALDKNIYYQRKNNKYHVLGHETDLSQGDVVKILGTAVHNQTCTDQEIKFELSNQLVRQHNLGHHHTEETKSQQITHELKRVGSNWAQTLHKVGKQLLHRR